MSPDVRLKEVTFRLWVDTSQYTDPSEWKLNEIFGFEGLIASGAMITRYEIHDRGRAIDYLAAIKRCRQQTT